MGKTIKIILVAVMVHLAASAFELATPMTYNDYDTFMAALPGPESVLDFETTLGIIENGDALGGITFNYSGPGNFYVGEYFPATSGSKTLRSDFLDEWIWGDVRLTFSPQNAIGMYFIVHEPNIGPVFMFVNDCPFEINFLHWPGLDLGNDVEVYFFGIIDTENSFTSVEVVTLSAKYVVDDIITATAPSSVPEPSTMLLLATGLLGVAGLGRKDSG